jgi:microsomal dipeptidase-like Zn-dependent dipeptidase
MAIIDLHCDLLGYLAHRSGRSVLSPEPRCSYPLLEKGDVKLQVLAMASMTDPQSVLFGQAQRKRFMQLPKECPMVHFTGEITDQVQIIGAYENASAFCSEEEPLDEGLKRLENTIEEMPLLYISLTWNGENRFGGGTGSSAGLKEDGKTLVEFLSGKGVALDFSHTSDALADELFNFLERKNLQLPVMASHSNFRAVQNEQRNLPDPFAREILRRGGIIGLVFFRPFVGPTFSTIIEQIEHGLSLGGEDQLALGADFFYDADWATALQKSGKPYGFFDEMKDSSCYPQLLNFLSDHFPPALLEKISHQNALSFIQPVRASQ